MENITVRNWISAFHLINPVAIALAMIAAMEMARSVEINVFTSLMETMRNMTAMVFVFQRMLNATRSVRQNLLHLSVALDRKQNVYL